MPNNIKTWPYPSVVAHRGGGKLAPENTLAAITTGASHGHTMVEFDAKLSLDNTVFLLHDDTINRTSNGKGLAALMHYQEISTFDAGSWLHPQFSYERMPTLSEAFACCAQYQLNANIEIKPCPGRDEETGRLIALEAQKLWKNHHTLPLFSSFSWVALEAAKKAAPEFPRGLLFDRLPDNWQILASHNDCFSLHINYRYLTKTLVHNIKDAGLFIFSFTVNDLNTAKKLLQWGVDCICTDEIHKINLETLSLLNLK